MPPKLHRESLLRVPLVQQALSDRGFRWRARALDSRWASSRSIARGVTGFSPATGNILYDSHSPLARWLKKPEGPARRLNEDDTLVTGLFTGVHDYLHAWSYVAIRDLAPRLGFGTRPINSANIEDFVFCHLLTEAAAVVGLDYWYLSTVDLNDICDLGTRYERFAVSYCEKDRDEFRRFSPSFEVQTESFFSKIAEFYCSGAFPDFSIQDISRSPKLLRWVRHELAYGDKQRAYTRLWLSYLAAGPIQYSARELAAEVSLSPKWRRQLIKDLGRLLWEKVKLGAKTSLSSPIRAEDCWKRTQTGPFDFRFTNLNSLDPDELADRSRWIPGRENFLFLFHQFVSSHIFESVDPRIVSLFPELIEKQDFELVRDLFRDAKRVPRAGDELTEIFMIG